MRPRSRSDPSFEHEALWSSVQFIDRPPPLTSPFLPAIAASHPAYRADETLESDWKSFVESMLQRRQPQDFFHRVSRRKHDNVSWGVIVFELAVTVVFLSFSTISFWFGTWTVLDVAVLRFFGTTQSWQGVGVCLGFGFVILLLVNLMGRAFLAKLIYRRSPPRTWLNLALRTFGDRFNLYVQAWASISIWKGIWDLWLLIEASNPI